MYWIYVLYGFSVLAIFNSILSTLDYFKKSMPDYSPEFVVDLGLNIFVTISAIFVIVYGHLLSFEVKNNFMIIVQIPFTLALPLACKLIESEKIMFIVFIASLMLLGIVNSLQLGSVYAQAGSYPNDR